MIRLFRKIRHQLLSEDKYSTYFLYAFGEMFLVVVGILLALQIDNWNQIRKDKLEAENLFQDLKISLQTDLKEIERVLEITSLSLEDQNIILTISTDEILDNYDKEELIEMVRNIWAGVNSFYPKLGVYNQIVSSNLMRLIGSPELKNTLMDYYDYKCTRYNTLDVVLDQKYHETFQSFYVRGAIHQFQPGLSFHP